MILAATLGLWLAAAPLPALDNRIYFGRPIAEADVRGRSLRELSLMRNTIYARAGNPFRKKWLHEHFAAQPWYAETGLDESRLSELDRTNAAFLDRTENTLPRAELDLRYQGLLARHHRSAGAAILALAFSPDGRQLAAVTAKEATLWGPAGEKLSSAAIAPGVDHPWAIGFAPDGRSPLLVTSPLWPDRAPSKLQVEQLGPAGERQRLSELVLTRGSESLKSVLLLPGGRQALVAAAGQLTLWQLQPAAQLWSREGAFLPLGAGARDLLVQGPGGLELWDLASGQRDPSPVLPAWARTPAGAVSRLQAALSPDGATLAGQVGSDLVLWDLVQGREKARVTTRPAPPRTAVLDAESMLPLFDEPPEPDSPRGFPVRFSPDGRQLLEGEPGVLTARSALSGAPRWSQATHPPVLQPQLIYSPDGARLAFSEGRTLTVWEAASGAPVPGFGPAVWSGEEAIEAQLLARALGVVPPPELGQDADRNPLDDVGLLEVQLTLQQLADLSRRDLMLLRNTVAARRGKVFPATLGAYFARMEWYRPLPDYREDRLTAQDRKNLKLISSLEHSLGGPLPDRDDPEKPRRRMLG